MHTLIPEQFTDTWKNISQTKDEGVLENLYPLGSADQEYYRIELF